MDLFSWFRKRGYRRDETFNYFDEPFLVRRKYAPENNLSKFYWAGVSFGVFISRRFYALRLFFKGLKQYFIEYKD